MTELDLFTSVVRRLLAADLPAYRPLPEEATGADRLHRVARNLLTLSSELREELPRPLHFLRLAAVSAAETALLVALPGTGPNAAVALLEDFQRARLRKNGPRFRKAARWRVHPPEEHLLRAFWNLAGVASEISVHGARDGLLEEHATDTANYLVLSVFTSGAFHLALRQGGEVSPQPEAPSSSPSQPPVRSTKEIAP